MQGREGGTGLLLSLPTHVHAARCTRNAAPVSWCGRDGWEHAVARQATGSALRTTAPGQSVGCTLNNAATRCTATRCTATVQQRRCRDSCGWRGTVHGEVSWPPSVQRHPRPRQRETSGGRLAAKRVRHRDSRQASSAHTKPRPQVRPRGMSPGTRVVQASRNTHGHVS